MRKTPGGSFAQLWQNPREIHFFKIMNYFIALLLISTSLNQNVLAADRMPIRLWEKGAPGTPATKSDDEPVMYMTRPSGHRTKTAVIILPGGGYGHLAITYEGH